MTCQAVHCEVASHLAAAARLAGLGRFVRISGIGADPAAADAYVRARGCGEATARAAFPSAVIVRPSVMFGPDDALLAAILSNARRWPVVPLSGRGRTRLHPVHVHDAALACADRLSMTEAAALDELVGPPVLT